MAKEIKIDVKILYCVTFPSKVVCMDLNFEVESLARKKPHIEFNIVVLIVLIPFRRKSGVAVHHKGMQHVAIVLFPLKFKYLK